jgi:opacity protein-like surface antigen
MERSAMYIRRLCVATLSILSAFCATAALAQSPIGDAASVQNDVQASLNRKPLPISTGGSVFQNERLYTGEASQANLVFLDNTDFFLGPTSQATLNRFIYNPDSGTGRVQIETDRGVFRFVTGKQDKKDYEVVTPSGTIHVKGTEFQLLVSKGYIIVALESGALTVTPNKGRVVSVDQPGTSVTVHKDGRVEGPTPFSGTITRYANAQFPYFGNALPPALNVLTSFSFTGCYVGAQTGVSQAFTRFENTTTDPTGTTSARSSDPHYRPSIGGISGCSYQFGPIVVGGEVEYGYDGHSSSGVTYSGGPPAFHGGPLPEHVLGQSFNTTGLGRVRSSAGYTVLPNLLVYVAGGWTFAGTNTALNGVVGAASPIDVSASNNKIVNGGNAGFGAEYAFAPGLIARVEYIYDRFTPSYNYDFPAVSAVSRSSAKYNENTMRAALLFKF